MTGAIAYELQRLQIAYATALDNRNREGLYGVFSPDAVFAVYGPDETEPTTEIQGHEQLPFIVDGLGQRYAKTLHVMTNHACQTEGDGATGTVYCTAYHLILDDGAPREFVARLRYVDSFRRDGDDSWRIARREARFLWATEHAALDWETAQKRGRLI
jgi:hypothetical protein